MFIWSVFLSHFASLCFYILSGSATSLKLEGMVLCMVIPSVDSACLVTFAGWWELWLVGLWIMGTLCWVCCGEMTEAGACANWGSLVALCAGGALAGQVFLTWVQAEGSGVSPH